MARLFTSGFELGHLTSEGLTIAGSAAVATDQARTGSYSLKFITSAASSYAGFPISGVSGRDYFVRDYVRVSALPNSGNFVLIFEFSTDNWCEIRINNNGALVLDDGTNGDTGISANGVIAANTWYCVEMRLRINTGGTDECEIRLNGTTVISVSIAISTANISAVNFGQDSGTSSGVNVWHDDIAVNDNQGSDQNSWPGDGAVSVLLPDSQNQQGTGWLKPGGASTNLNTSIDNIPSQGIAHSTTPGNAEKQIYNITSTAVGDHRANMQTYDAAGIPSGNTITLVQTIAVTGANSATGTPTGSLEVVSNPAIAEVNFGTFRAAANAGTFPTGWISRKGTVAYNPSVVRATAPVVEAGKRTASTTACLISQLALMVEHAVPAVVPASLLFSHARRRQYRIGR